MFAIRRTVSKVVSPSDLTLGTTYPSLLEIETVASKSIITHYRMRSAEVDWETHCMERGRVFKSESKDCRYGSDV